MNQSIHALGLAAALCLWSPALCVEPPAASAPAEPAVALRVGVPAPTALASAANLNAVRMNRAQRIELHVADLPILEVLRMLSSETRRNIVASNGVSGSVTANLYDVTLEQALAAVLAMNRLAYREVDDFIYVHTQEEMAEIKAAERHVTSRVFHLRYINAADAKALLEPLLSERGRIAVTPPAQVGLYTGSTTGGSSAATTGAGASSANAASGVGNSLGGGDALVVTDEIDRLRRMADVLKEVDVRPQQILIESTILRASLNENNALGIDFTTLGGVDFAQVGSTSAAAQNINTGDLPTESLDKTTFTTRTGFVGNVPPGGLTFGIIKNNIAIFIRALEEVADTSVIANPKVLALNKQRGEVIVGRRDGYTTTTVTDTAAIQTVEFLETGTQLIFRPFILDPATVRLEIHPKDSIGGLTPANLPFEQTTEVTTNILVRDGHTIVIGGLFREVTNANRSQLPFLGNIPIAGALFRSSDDSTIREEVIILLTVRIMKGEPEEEEGEKLADQVERYRIGNRQGLLPLGRERIAQAHYRWALEHLAAGRLSQAEWDARMAIHNAPKFVPAMELIETLERKRQWDEDASAVRSHLRRLIAPDADPNHPIEMPPYERPAPPFKMPIPLDEEGGHDPADDDAPQQLPAASQGVTK